MSIGTWLQKHGLGQYESLFVENAIDTDVLPEITEDDLVKLGIPIGDRKRLITSIRQRPEDGAAVSGANGAHDAAAATRARTTAERRHLTVMICDLVDSTKLSTRLDPEEMAAIIDAFQAACARITLAYDGFIADFRGDGILAYFGYPKAHDDDAERTVRAALDIVAAIPRLKTPASEPLSVRIGIASGLVVVGNAGRDGIPREHAVIGDTPNLAARIQGLAEPGMVLVAASTRKLLGNRFVLRDHGTHKLKGIAEPVTAWGVDSAFASESPLDAVDARHALIGRESELEFLLKRKRLAWKGAGQIALISGEPGIGKSRLAAAIQQGIGGEPHTTLHYQCSSYHTNSPLYPFIARIERAANFKADDTPAQRLEKLEAAVSLPGAPAPDTLPLFASLLSIPLGDRYAHVSGNPAQLRRLILAAMLDQFEALARQKPILLLFEDAQWADSTSLELLDLAVDRVRKLPVFAVFTFRPEFDAPWIGLPNVGSLRLGPLNRTSVENIIAQVAGNRSLSPLLTHEIVAKTDGNPLFVEELTKAVLEGGISGQGGETKQPHDAMPSLVPATLHDSLMARLDRLEQVKEVAQIGAAMGREFSYTLIREMVGGDEAALTGALDRLEQAELVFRRGQPPDAIYTFKHALVRDIAYESLLKTRRKQLHGQIARTLEARFHEIVTGQPELVAHHFSEAGLIEPAIRYWIKAGHLALNRSATAAVAHLKQGLKQLPGVEDETARKTLELLLQTSLGNSLQALKGWSTEEVKDAYTRALHLCQDTGLDQDALPAIFGLWTWNFVRPSFSEAKLLAEHLLHAAETIGDAAYKVLGHEALGFTYLAQGHFGAARTELERSMALCGEADPARYIEISGQDPRVHARLYYGMVLWFLGYPDQALRACAEARVYAEASRRPFTEAMARTISLRIHQLRGESGIVARQANAALDICKEHEFAHYLAMALVLRGWASAHEGRVEEGCADIREGLKREQETGASLYESYGQALLAEIYVKNARYEDAIDLLQRTSAKLERRGSEYFYAAEIYRLLGEAQLRLGSDLGEAEKSLMKGLSIAREQGAKSFELKLMLTLHELYEARQGAGQYQAPLLQIFRSFGEGFDTADLVRAEGKLKRAGLV
jgi:class 3 adenylate cyclase/predicted ATPase